jgi:hypothetical protein
MTDNKEKVLCTLDFNSSTFMADLVGEHADPEGCPTIFKISHEAYEKFIPLYDKKRKREGLELFANYLELSRFIDFYHSVEMIQNEGAVGQLFSLPVKLDSTLSGETLQLVFIAEVAMNKLQAIAKCVADAGGADKDCCHQTNFPCWMEGTDGMYCACLHAANKIVNIVEGKPQPEDAPGTVRMSGVIGHKV